MAASYKYEYTKEALDGTITVRVVVFDDTIPDEQTILELEFLSGSSVTDIETKVSQYATTLMNLDRS